MITDWSKKGIGFVIMQKHCNCVNDIMTRAHSIVVNRVGDWPSVIVDI